MIKDEAFKQWLGTSGVAYREDVAWAAWQARGEQDRKELEAAKQRIAELDKSDYHKPCREFERVAIAAKVALEKKLAEQQAFTVSRLCKRCANGETATRIAHADGKRYVWVHYWKGALSNGGDVEKGCGASELYEHGAEELTKLLAAARAEGFEEGKQAGRDEVQKEMSEQEPVAYDIQYSCEQVSPYITRTVTHSDDFSSVKNTFGFEVNIISKDELILRPQPPRSE